MTNGVFHDDTTPPTRSSPNIIKKMTNGVFRDDTTTPARSSLSKHHILYGTARKTHFI